MKEPDFQQMIWAWRVVDSANLRSANLRSADLRYANLSYAYRPANPPTGWKAREDGLLVKA